MKRSPDYQVYFDFDNTITVFDVLDDIIKRFSINKKWISIEKRWKQGKIGSKECLKRQLASVRISRKELLKYLSSIKLDLHFKKLYAFLKDKGIHPVILSDDFSFIIKRLLLNNDVKGIKVYSNELKFKKDRLVLSFPHTNNSCFMCAHCKKKNLLKKPFSDKIIYIGDGFSDVCPAKQADIVFAKGSLLKYFRKAQRKCVAIKDLGDVYNRLKGVL